uniref:Saposin B-type domain-containing protein n=2 Tax=Schistosoma mansoni TaxID=6183 RepID=A0A3Q0KTY8_SCHMA
MNNYFLIILLYTIWINRRTNGTQLMNKQCNEDISSSNYTIQSTIKCSFCKIIVNTARKVMMKLSTIEMIHSIIYEMCSVIEEYTLECYDVASQIVDSYLIVFNRTQALDTCMQVSFCS